MESFRPLLAILWAQWRVSANFLTRARKGSLAIKWITGLLWYGAWVVAAFGAAFLTSGRVPATIIARSLPAALFFLLFFWQLFPIVMASQGAFIDLRRLLVYPIPSAHLFLLETLLRITTAVEMLLVAAGFCIGLAINKDAPWWAPLAILAYVVFNLLLASGLKSALGLLFQKKGVREIVMFLFLGVMLTPQLLVARLDQQPATQIRWLQGASQVFQVLPWAAVSRLALGWSAASAAAMIVWLGAAYAFARIVFERTLRLEDSMGSSTETAPASDKPTWIDRIASLPSKVFLDPIAALVEKDIRTLARSPRFRLIFTMAATFGAIIWLPQAMRGGGGWMTRNYATMAVLYGMLVLGEVIYWNVFGFERAGAQQWFVTPLRFRDVLRAKNVVAVMMTGLSILVLSVIILVLPVGNGLPQIADAIMAACVFLGFVLGGGNMTSVYSPKPIDGEQTWRNSGSKVQFLLLFVYPVLLTPVTLAYLARWATGNYWAYHGVLAAALFVSLCFYSVATETAAEVAEQRKEEIIAKLSHKEGPISITS